MEEAARVCYERIRVLLIGSELLMLEIASNYLGLGPFTVELVE